MDVALNRHVLLNQRRLQTFFTTPLPCNEYSISNSPLKLAEAGFVRSKNAVADEVECCFCGVKYSGWSGESPIAVHRTLNPKCSFLNTPPKTNSSLHGTGNHRNELDSFRRQFSLEPENGSSSIRSVPDIVHPFLPKQGGFVMLFESHRRLTFIYNDPFSMDAVVYAEGGFIYNVATKSVFCVFCNLELDLQHISRSILESIHEKKSPFCPFVLLFDVGNISLDTERRIREKSSLQRQHKIQTDNKIKYAIKHPEFEDEAVRLGTYSTWPKCLAKMFPGKIMAESGFYYTGTKELHVFIYLSRFNFSCHIIY